MDELDFSDLTDDQILGLIRAALREMVGRSPGAAAAAEAAMIDEAERARIIRSATDSELARMRAQERAKVAAEAAQAVRAAQAAEESEATKRRAKEAAAAAAAAAAEVEKRERATRTWLSRAAELTGRAPNEISLLILPTNYGRRVLINQGSDRYARDHLADWNCDSKQIKTERALIKKRKEIAAFCAEFASIHTGRNLALIGADQDWTA